MIHQDENIELQRHLQNIEITSRQIINISEIRSIPQEEIIRRYVALTQNYYAQGQKLTSIQEKLDTATKELSDV